MADAIVIKIKLDPQDIPATGKEITQQLSSALNSSVESAKQSGRKIANALNTGLEEGLKRAIETAKKLNEVLSSTKRHLTEEEKERAHQRRMESLRERTIAKEAQTAAKIRENESKSQAQIDVIRERAAQREIERQSKLARATQTGAGNFQSFLRRYSSTIREAGESIQQAGYGALGLTTAIIGVGAAAIRSAIELDKQVNVLKALSGSADIAEKRLSDLIALSQKTPGLTTTLAATLDAQLRVASVTEQTINRILPAIGRLNAVSPIGDTNQFVRNLTQIGQSFDKQDLKELVENSAFSGELIKQLFNVNSPTNAEAIKSSAKKLGFTTVEQFINAFAQAAENNPKLAKVTESLGTQLEKLQDRIIVALRPLGIRLLEIIVPAVEALVPIVEGAFRVFSKLPDGLQVSIIAFAALAASIGPVVIGLGGLIQFTGAIGNLATVLAALSASSVVATTGVAGLSAGGAAATVSMAGLSAIFPPLLITLGAIAAAVGLVIVAYKLLSSSSDNSANTILKNVEASKKQVDVSQEQIDKLRNLAESGKVSNEEQKKVEELYNKLTPLQQARIELLAGEGDGIDTVSGKLRGLIKLLEEENKQRKDKARDDAIENGKKLAYQTDYTIEALRRSQGYVKLYTDELGKAKKSYIEAEKSGKVYTDFLTGVKIPATNGAKKRVEEYTEKLKNAEGWVKANEKSFTGSGEGV